MLQVIADISLTEHFGTSKGNVQFTLQSPEAAKKAAEKAAASPSPSPEPEEDGEAPEEGCDCSAGEESSCSCEENAAGTEVQVVGVPAGSQQGNVTVVGVRTGSSGGGP